MKHDLIPAHMREVLEKDKGWLLQPRHLVRESGCTGEAVEVESAVLGRAVVLLARDRDLVRAREDVAACAFNPGWILIAAEWQ
jgi:hypothetical protein